MTNADELDLELMIVVAGECQQNIGCAGFRLAADADSAMMANLLNA